MVTSGMQLISMYFVGFRKGAGIMWINSCRAMEVNQRVKKSSGAKLNPPVRTKDPKMREISVEQQIAGSKRVIYRE